MVMKALDSKVFKTIFFQDLEDTKVIPKKCVTKLPFIISLYFTMDYFPHYNLASAKRNILIYISLKQSQII